MKLVLATRNPHKTREFAELLGKRFLVEDLTAADLNLPEETGATFLENATIKVLAASRALNELVVADDSGLEVDALAGAPGVFSARFAGPDANDQANVALLLARLKEVPAGKRTARFRCAIAVAANGQLTGSVEGSVEGVIADHPRGQHGFGYDPVFVPRGYQETFAEMTPARKNGLSHRAQAVARLRQLLGSIQRRDATA